MSDSPAQEAAGPSAAPVWVPGDVPDALRPPPSLEELTDDIEQAWRPTPPPDEKPAPAADGPVPPADVVALVGVAVAGLVLLATMVPVVRRVAELSRDGLADRAVVPALIGLVCLLVFAAWSFVHVLGRRARRSGGRERVRHRVLAWTWVAAAVLLATVRVTGSFALFGDPLAGALEVEPSGSLFGVDVPKAAAVGAIWAGIYVLAAAPAVALVLAALQERGRLEGVQVVLTRSGPVLQKEAPPQMPRAAAAPDPSAAAPDPSDPTEAP